MHFFPLVQSYTILITTRQFIICLSGRQLITVCFPWLEGWGGGKLLLIGKGLCVINSKQVFVTTSQY